MNIDITKKDLTFLLRYSQVEIQNSGLDFQYILKKSSPLLISEQILYIYLTKQEREIYEDFEEEHISRLRRILNTSRSFTFVGGIFSAEISKLEESINTTLEAIGRNDTEEILENLKVLNSNKYFSTYLQFLNLENDITESIKFLNEISLLPNWEEKEGQDDSFVSEIFIPTNQEILDRYIAHITDRGDLSDKYSDILKTFSYLKENQGKILNSGSSPYTQDLVHSLSTLKIPNVSILLRNISSNGSDTLTISPYISNNIFPEIDDSNFDEGYDITPQLQSKGTVRIPVLMYHQIANAPEGSSKFVKGLYISPEEFETQIAYLTRKNYKTISSEEFSNLLKEGKNPEQKSIMLTFDDGTPSHYTAAYPILKKYKQTGVFFIPSARSSIEHEQLEEMANNGMIIDSHSATHPNLENLDDLEKLRQEIAGSKIALEARTGKKVFSIAYPGCVADQETYSVVASSGYSLGFSCGRWIDHYQRSRYSLSRVHAFGDMDSFLKILSGR